MAHNPQWRLGISMATGTHKAMPSTARRPHFLDAFQPDSSSERLKLPCKFIKHLEGKTSGSVLLIGPSEKIWHVDLIQQNDSLFFHNGWPEFVRDHFIECGDMLVFRYDGSLQFTVQVFDQSACEKEGAYHANCSQDPRNIDKNMGKKRERVHETASSDIFVEAEPKKMKTQSSEVNLECITNSRKAVVEISDKEGSYHEEMAIDETFQEPIPKTEKCGSPSKISAIPTDATPCSGKPEATPKNRTSTNDEKKLPSKGSRIKSTHDEEKVARSFTSSFPYFVRIMKKFNISGSYTLKIPYKFSMEHLPKCKIKVVLHNLKGEHWTVNSVPTTKVHTSHTLCGGWMAFVRGNDINMGDICIFELVGKCELRVLILGDGREGLKKSLSEKAASDGFTTGCGATSDETFEGLPKKMKEKSSKAQLELASKVYMSDKSKKCKVSDLYNIIKKRRSASKSSGKYAQHSPSKVCKEKTETAIQNGSSAEVELGSKARDSTRMMSASAEEKAAQSFNSRFPNFVKIMKKFNISGSYTLKVPHQFSVVHLPNCKTEIVLRNSKGECWNVNSVPALNRQADHTFCGGWGAFIRGNNVKIGDICIFELVDKKEMLVHISEVGKKGTEHQNGKSLGQAN